jgi:iron complex transport system substrate-binding protein
LALAATLALVNAQEHPQRIITLVPAVTEMIYALGAGNSVVGVSNFDRFPPAVETVPRVGALLDPNLERILSLKPDLVIVYRSQTELRAQLERAQVPVYTYSHAGLADVTETLRAVGERIGRGEQAGRLSTDMESRIAAIQRRYAVVPRPRALVVFEREAGTLRGIYASGGRGFIHDMVTAAGGENVFADVSRQAVQATAELILARRPDVILELRADPLAPEQMRRERAVWDQLRSVPAVRSGRVHILTDPRTVVPGPRIVEGLEAIAARLHSLVAPNRLRQGYGESAGALRAKAEGAHYK